MGFELVKLIGGLLMPVPVILTMLFLGLFLTLIKMRRLGLVLLLAGSCLLLLLSTPFLPEKLLNDLEQTYPVLQDPPQTKWILVLGGGARGEEGLPPASRLGEASLYRLAEGLRLAKAMPEAKLVTSGGSFSAGPSSARLMARTAEAWGLDPERVVVQEEPLNTAQEAEAMASRIQGQERIILVTSAYHMPRAMQLFQAQGLEVVPAPTGHLVDPGRSQRHIGHQLPQAGYLRFAEKALWERLGLVWARLQDKFPGLD
ncbi:MAG: ElyC/SanA/YdcF family protein [Desulfohalobiaceae bacterium]